MRNEYLILIEAWCALSPQEVRLLPTMLTTPHPAWLRGAPAQPAGARERSVTTSWGPSPATSVSVSPPLSSIHWNVVTQDFGARGCVYIEVFAFLRQGGETLNCCFCVLFSRYHAVQRKEMCFFPSLFSVQATSCSVFFFPQVCFIERVRKSRPTRVGKTV